MCDYIAGKHTREEFFATFHPNAMSKDFDPDQDLQSIGIANQTTMLKVLDLMFGAPLHFWARHSDTALTLWPLNCCRRSGCYCFL